MPERTSSTPLRVILAMLMAATLSACQTDATPAPTATAAALEPAPPAARPTAEQARATCWMSLENDKKTDLNKKADMVEKCVQDRMTGRPAR